jgi:amidase
MIDVAEARHTDVDGSVNAIPTTCFDRARERATEVDQKSLLAGLPIVIKDLTEVAGVRTTFGSPIFADHVPESSDILVERLEAHGALIIGKTNTPEFGAGGNTFNPVFGMTRNPWDTRMSAAGSSGGAAVSLATGTSWLAHGSDFGGSLRTPAGFNSIVGLRPSPGRVPFSNRLPWDPLSVQGPMARNVTDLALFLDALSGFDLRDPLSLPAPDQAFVDAVAGADRNPPKRVAWSSNLGFAVVDPVIAAACAEAAAGLAAFGAEVMEAAPDLADAADTFQTLRARRMVNLHSEKLKAHRDQIKDDLIWNIEKGLALSMEEVAVAEAQRTAIHGRMAAFFQDYDLLLCPAMQALPYPVEQLWVDEIAGQKLDTYIDWISITFAISITACPALSLPCGFSEDGLPIGLQIVGPPRGEAQVLAAAALLEEMLGVAGQLPIDPIVSHA